MKSFKHFMETLKGMTLNTSITNKMLIIEVFVLFYGIYGIASMVFI